MSPSRRDDDNRAGRERTPEQRELDRLEREARRRGQPAAAAPNDPLAPTTDRHDRRPPPTLRRARPAAEDPADDSRDRRARRAAEDAADDSRDRRPRRAAEDAADGARDRRARPGAEAASDGPRADRRAARRAGPARPSGPPLPRDEQPVLRIQPDPPAPPPLPAGAFGDDDPDQPIGIRRVRRAVAPRTPRAIVTPPGDVPAGPARARRTARTRIVALLALAIFAALLIGVLLLFQPFGSAQGAAVRVTIPAGASAGEIGDQLAKSRVVASGSLFALRAALAGKRSELRSGPVTLHKDMTYGDAIEALSKRTVVSAGATVDVTIPEGRSRNETARLLKAKGIEGDYLGASKRFRGRLNPFRYGAPSGTRTTEGFLFPATYELKAGAPAGDLVDKQLVAFKENFAKVDLRRARRKQLTAYDVLIIASMVEREAQLASERPKIAAVIYNRLKDGIALGIDATTRYALDNWTRPLKESELHIDSPYNTRDNKGLPPTPIGNPGLASIRAAAAPANVDYRYYVVAPGKCGTHAFSSSKEQFDRDSARYNRAREAAGGKSPTTC